MSTTPLDDLRVEVAVAPVRDPVPAAPPAADLVGRISRQQPRVVLGQLGLHVGEPIGAQDLRKARKTP